MNLKIKAVTVLLAESVPLHFDKHPKHVYRSVVKTCTFKVSRHSAPRHAVAKAERIHGVMGAYWNPHTHEMTVRYDARMTTARHIMHSVA